MVGAHQNLNGSLVPWPRPFQGRLPSIGYHLLPFNLYTKFEVSFSIHYEHIKRDKDAEHGLVWVVE